MNKNIDFIAPFIFDKNTLVSKIEEHMISGSFIPEDILENSSITSQEFKFIPFYRYKGRYDAQWSASFGYDRKEEYIAVRPVTYDMDDPRWRQTTKVSRTRTITDWKIASGVHSGSFEHTVYAGRIYNSQLQKQIENQNSFQKLLPFDDKYINGCQVDDFESDSETVFNSLKSKIDSEIEKGIKTHSKGDRQKDWTWTFSTEKKVERIFLPVAFAAFEYNGKTYNLWLNGLDESKVFGDSLPVDSEKQKEAFSSFQPVLAVILALIFSYNVFGSASVDGYSYFGLAIALMYGLLRSGALAHQSHNIAKNILSQKRKGVDEINISPLPFIADSKNKKKHFIIVAVICSMIVLINGFVKRVDENGMQNVSFVPEFIFQANC
jgi:hypothetical protein